MPRGQRRMLPAIARARAAGCAHRLVRGTANRPGLPGEAAVSAAQSDQAGAGRHIWLVNLYFGKGIAPTGTLLEDVAVALVARGYEVTAVCGNPTYHGAAAAPVSRFRGNVTRLWSGAS